MPGRRRYAASLTLRPGGTDSRAPRPARARRGPRRGANPASDPRRDARAVGLPRIRTGHGPVARQARHLGAHSGRARANAATSLASQPPGPSPVAICCAARPRALSAGGVGWINDVISPVTGAHCRECCRTRPMRRSSRLSAAANREGICDGGPPTRVSENGPPVVRQRCRCPSSNCLDMPTWPDIRQDYLLYGIYL